MNLHRSQRFEDVFRSLLAEFLPAWLKSERRKQSEGFRTNRPAAGLNPATVEIQREGGCLCGAVRFRVSGAPLRVGLCHCQDCRRASGSFFTPFGVWPIAAYTSSGKMRTFAQRSFCPNCGGRIAWLRNDEAEIMLGSLDIAPSDLIPEYELWTSRRENWLAALPWADQFDGDRPV
jgi:hypothetical protein